MLETMKSLVRSGSSCVLATCRGDRPHCSLMAYAPDGSCRKLYMATSRRSTKFRNLTDNPRVSLLIDTRDSAGGRERVQALTVAGVCTEVEGGAEKEAARRRLLAVQPRLRTFWEEGEPAVLCVRVESFLLLDGVHRAHYVELE